MAYKQACEAAKAGLPVSLARKAEVLAYLRGTGEGDIDDHFESAAPAGTSSSAMGHATSSEPSGLGEADVAASAATTAGGAGGSASTSAQRTAAATTAAGSAGASSGKIQNVHTGDLKAWANAEVYMGHFHEQLGRWTSMSVADDLYYKLAPFTHVAMGATGGSSDFKAAQGTAAAALLGTAAVKYVGVPVILVPRSTNPMISLYNIGHFLEHGEYYTHAEGVRKAGANSGRVNSIIIKHRNRHGVDAEFEVRDDVHGFREWNRVVGVFVDGPAWQFKGWQISTVAVKQRRDSTPAEILDALPGFYVHYDDVPIPDQVSKWNVHKLPLARNRRHMDSVAYNRCWNVLTQYMEQKKPFLIKKSASAVGKKRTRT